MKNKSIRFLTLISLVVFTCSRTAIGDTSTEQLKTRYDILTDVSYGSHQEQVMDIYIPKHTKSSNSEHFTIVFIHGGAYWGSDKSKEERYIHPYLKKGYPVVNMN